MTVGELMQGFTPDPAFEGFLTADDNVLAIDISEKGDAPISAYVVAAMGITGFDPQLNPSTNDSQYIRTGVTTTKNGTQRTFGVAGDRYFGDDFQDYCLSHKMIYGVGNDVVRPYIFFNVKNGKGEKGRVSIIVNSDNGGDAGSNATIDIGLSKAGENPTEFVYSSEPVLIDLAVVSTAGASGKTAVSVTPALPTGQTARYKTSASVTLPGYGDTVTAWTSFTDGSEYAATAGNDFAVVYLDADNKVVAAGKATAVVGA